MNPFAIKKMYTNQYVWRTESVTEGSHLVDILEMAKIEKMKVEVLSGCHGDKNGRITHE